MGFFIAAIAVMGLIPAKVLYAADPVLQIRIRAPQSESDVAHSYFRELLALALKKTADEYGPAKVVVTSLNITQNRALSYLNKGDHIDINWTGTNKERETVYRPIRVPLNLGLLGYRMLAISKEKETVFDQISTLAELKKLSACQGAHWPDSDILQEAGFKVIRAVKFESMYEMLLAGRCDYFPRSVAEGYGEVESIAPDQLMAYDRIIIAYRFPMYFFVGKDNAALAVRVKKGLLAALDDGSFLALLKKHPVTSKVFPLSKYKETKVFWIENSYLSEQTPLAQKRYWLKVGE
jgi:ABC-type amino acid transport substrate-binding protein